MAFLINKLNKIRVLNIIREHDQISRADISKISGISAPTITRIVNNLIENEHLVNEVGAGESSGGRKPTLVEFSANKNYVIGVDIGKTHIDGILSDLNANIVSEIRIGTKIEEGYESIISRTSDIICELKNDKNKVIYVDIPEKHAKLLRTKFAGRLTESALNTLYELIELKRKTDILWAV